MVNGRNPIVAHEYLGESVEGKDVFVADDIISSGESMLDIAFALKKQGARRIFANATYAIFTNGLAAFDEAVEQGVLNGVFGTNLTYLTPELKSRAWFHEVDVSKYIAYYIAAVNHDISVSAIIDPHEKIRALLDKTYGQQSLQGILQQSPIRAVAARTHWPQAAAVSAPGAFPRPGNPPGLPGLFMLYTAHALPWGKLLRRWLPAACAADILGAYPGTGRGAPARPAARTRCEGRGLWRCICCFWLFGRWACSFYGKTAPQGPTRRARRLACFFLYGAWAAVPPCGWAAAACRRWAL